MNKKLLLVTVGILAALTLSGCGDDPTPAKTPTPTTTTTPVETAAPTPSAPVATEQQNVVLSNGVATVNGITITCVAGTTDAILYTDGTFSCSIPVTDELDNLFDEIEG